MSLSITDPPLGGVTAPTGSRRVSRTGDDPSRLTYWTSRRHDARLWVVSGATGALELSAVYTMPARCPSVILDENGQRMQAETVTVHLYPIGGEPEVLNDCPILGLCYLGGMQAALSVNMLRRWEQDGHPAGQIEDELRRMYPVLIGGQQ